MEGLSCQSWVQFLWEKVYQLFYPSSSIGRQLPNDIIVDIFSRLPAECVVRCAHPCKLLRALTRSPAFVDKHLIRATPVIACSYHGKSERIYRINLNVHFTDEVGRTISKKSMSLQGYALPALYGSYRGLLVFKGTETPSEKSSLCSDDMVFIWNPMSERIVSVGLRSGSLLCGFYVHPPTMEYRILYQKLSGGQVENCFVYGLMTKGSRQITTFSHPPTTEKAPIQLHGHLHWMVSDDTYKQLAHGVPPDCSNSIVLFNINSEEFSTMLHPGVECGLKKKHCQMELMEMEGRLCCCDSSSNLNVVIWILEDYENKIWEKTFIIAIEPLLEFCDIQWRYGYNVNVGGFQIYNKELLLRVSKNDLILYNLHTGICRRVGKRVKNDLLVVAVPHLNTLVMDFD